jgi:internalin A
MSESDRGNPQPAKIFYSYAHQDEKLRNKLGEHLVLLERQRLIENWHDREILAGEDWKGQIDEHLETADIILLLVSASFLASAYCYDVEMKRAMERHDAGEARVILSFFAHAIGKARRSASYKHCQKMPNP